MRVIASVLLCCWISVASVVAKTLPLPSYITPCSKNVKDLGACALKSGREAIPKFIKGDRKYKIPPLDPLEISHLHVDAGVLGLNFTATNVSLHGLPQARLDNVTWDTENSKGAYYLYFPHLEVDAHYSIDGRILILPITGNGRANLTFSDVTVNYTFSYEIVTRSDGHRYFLPKDSNLAFDTTRMYIYLDNLFNGNKLLADQTNAFMNENWKDMIRELGPVMADTVGEIMRRIQYNIFELVDYDEAFPDT